MGAGWHVVLTALAGSAPQGEHAASTPRCAVLCCAGRGAGTPAQSCGCIAVGERTWLWGRRGEGRRGERLAATASVLSAAVRSQHCPLSSTAAKQRCSVHVAALQLSNRSTAAVKPQHCPLSSTAAKQRSCRSTAAVKSQHCSCRVAALQLNSTEAVVSQHCS